jgi:hypothetical protein
MLAARMVLFCFQNGQTGGAASNRMQKINGLAQNDGHELTAATRLKLLSIRGHSTAKLSVIANKS